MWKCSSCPYTTEYQASFIAHRATCNGYLVNWGGQKKPRVNWNTGILIVLIALFLSLYQLRPAQAANTCTIYVGKSGYVMLNVKSLPSGGWLSYHYYGTYKGRVNRVGIYTIGKPVAQEGARHWSAGPNGSGCAG